MRTDRKIWTRKKLPKRILVIRLQAMGDLVITLPYLQQLRNSLPAETCIDLLTREEVAPIPRNLAMFNKVYAIGGGRVFKRQVLYAALLLPRLLLNRYAVVIDLQNNMLSKTVRRILWPVAWSEFDKWSPKAAGERNRCTIEAVGLGNNEACFSLVLKEPVAIDDLLKRNGWDGQSELVVLNPAGAFTTRNWPIESYVDFAELWLQRFPHTQFVITGVALIAPKAIVLKQHLKDKLVNLVQQTTPLQAFAIVQKAKLVLSEDSGLMHMAWISGIPTLALFGSTRSDWSTPLGRHSLLLHSGDLPCGNCMLEHCTYGDTHCLTRYTPQLVFEKSLTLLQDN